MKSVILFHIQRHFQVFFHKCSCVSSRRKVEITWMTSYQLASGTKPSVWMYNVNKNLNLMPILNLSLLFKSVVNKCYIFATSHNPSYGFSFSMVRVYFPSSSLFLRLQFRTLFDLSFWTTETRETSWCGPV